MTASGIEYSFQLPPVQERNFWGSPDDPTLGWESIVGEGVDVREMPGDHRLFREPQVRVLAARLQASLEHTLQM